MLEICLPRILLARGLTLSVAMLLAGCATRTIVPDDPEATLAMPQAMSEFRIDSTQDDVIGEIQIIRARYADTLSDIARRFNVGYEEIVAANPSVDPWLPGEDTEVVIPTQWVLPEAPRKGIVVNLAAMRLFYFPKPDKGELQRVITHPVGIGRVKWKTPVGRTRIVAKAKAPTWIPTSAIRREHAQQGELLPAKVPPGPDNPMGSHVLRLGWPEYAIHGTNKPASVGLRGTHGCLRLYPEDIVSLYENAPVGTPVTIINEPRLAGFRGDMLYLQTYPLLKEDKRDLTQRTQALISRMRKQKGTQAAAPRSITVNTALVSELTKNPRAMALPIAEQGLSVEQWLQQAPRVKNQLPLDATWDGGAGDLVSENEK